MTSTTEPGVQAVGVDGSDGSRAALAWAIANAERGGPVQPVATWTYPWWASNPLVVKDLLAPTEENYNDITKRLVELTLDGLDRANVIEPLIVRGAAGPTLVEAAAPAGLLVVGARGHTGPVSGLLGSVSSHCVNHSTVPVAVIPHKASPSSGHGSVIVGYDGTKHADRAVAWAVTNSAPGTEVTLVNTWTTSSMANIDASAYIDVAQQAAGRSEAVSEKTLEHGMAVATEAPGADDRTVRLVSRQGDARSVLRELSSEADLLVLGARGHSGVAHLLVGSVTSSVIHDPVVPTVVVP